MFSGCLYQMLVDAMGVFLPDDPDGNAKLIFSILDCLPKANRVIFDDRFIRLDLDPVLLCYAAIEYTFPCCILAELLLAYNAY